MQVSKIVFAIAALVAGSAMAATPAANIAITSGASASKANFRLALANRCGGQLGEYTDGTTNVSTYVCAPAGSFSSTPTVAEYNAAGSINFTGTAFGEVRLNVSGGSFTAVCLLAGWPAGTACPTADLYWDPAAAALQASPAGSVVVGGLMDIEPTGFNPLIRTGIANPPVTESANFGQTFGIAVSNDLYNAMFADQQAAGKLPAACAVGNYNLPECVPVIGRAQVSTIMSSNDTNAAYTNGANFLAPSVAPGTVLKYARRVDTSGTQAVAQQYFMGTVCNVAFRPVVAQGTSSATAVFPVGQVGAAMQVFGLGSTGNVRTVLNQSGFAIGIISGENNQVTQSWKWLRVGGMSVGESAQPQQGGVTFTNTNTSLDGRYDFWFLSRVVRPSTTAASQFWTSVRTGFGAVPVNTTVGLFRTNETGFSRGTANSCANPLSN